MAIVFALGSSMPFAIAGPDSKPVAVLATLAALIAADLARRGHAPDAPATVMFVLIAGTLITGVTLYLFGLFKAGRWIRFVPYPVIAGFMAASGGLLAVGGIRIVTGTRSFLELMEMLARGTALDSAHRGRGVCDRHALHQARQASPGVPRPAARRNDFDARGLHAAGYSLGAARAGRVAARSLLRSGPARALAAEVHAQY